MQESPKVLIISQVPPPTHGSSIMTLRLFEALSSAGIETSVVSKPFSMSISDIGQNYFRKIFKVPAFLREIRKELKHKENVKSILFLTNRLPSFYLDVIVVLLAKAHKSEVIAYLHTSGFQRLAKASALNRFLLKCVFGWCTDVVTLSASLSREITSVVPDRKIKVIPNFTPHFSTFTPEGALKRYSNRTIVFVGNLIQTKGYMDFIEVFKKTFAIDNRIRAILIGAESRKGQLVEIRDEIRRLGLGGKLQVTGELSSEEIQEHMQRGALFVYPTKYSFEAQPLVLLEALSTGLPVLSYCAGSIADFINQDSGSVTLEKAEIGELQKEILVALSDFERWKDRSLKAGNYARQHFSKDRFGSSWLSVVRD